MENLRFSSGFASDEKVGPQKKKDKSDHGGEESSDRIQGCGFSAVPDTEGFGDIETDVGENREQNRVPENPFIACVDPKPAEEKGKRNDDDQPEEIIEETIDKVVQLGEEKIGGAVFNSGNQREESIEIGRDTSHAESSDPIEKEIDRLRIEAEKDTAVEQNIHHKRDRDVVEDIVGLETEIAEKGS